MVNVVLIARDRPRLTEQTLRTLYMNTKYEDFNLTTVDDGSHAETWKLIHNYGITKGNIEMVRFDRSVGIVGFLKNVGAWTSERVFGRGEFLCFIDNDIALMPNWLDQMIAVKEHIKCSEREDAKGYAVIGGYRHPYHGVNLLAMGETHLGLSAIEETDAVAGYMHFMRWATWDLYGPYDQHAKGVCQSEDFAFCRKVIENHGHVGYIHPPVLFNCGITNSEGLPAIGSETFPRAVGLVYE